MTNMYVRVGIDGGLLSLILFVCVLGFCFKTIGRFVRAHPEAPADQKFVWAIGSALFCHAVSFLGVSYFGQMIFFLYMTLGIVSGIRTRVESEETEVHAAGKPVPAKVGSS